MGDQKLHPMPKNSVVMHDVSKRFGETVALNKCSISIEPGEIHAIVGENGSGKSTLAKILSGVLVPDEGDFFIFGGTPRTPIEARALGAVAIFQEVLVADELSVFENLFAGADGAWRRGHRVSEARSLGHDMLKRLVDGEIDLDATVGTLPLSLKQWIVIGRSLLSEPKLLILDESSAALDLDATSRLHTEIKKLKAQGSCVVIVSHRIAELVKITDRATVLRDGSDVGSLSGREITEENLLSLMSPNRSILRKARPPAEGKKTGIEEAIVSAKGISISNGGLPFDFTLNRGEIVGVAGLDGQGHTSFVRVMAGIMPSFGGEITVTGKGKRIALNGVASAAEGGVAFVSGDRAREGIFPNLSVFENFCMAMYRSTSGPLGWINRRTLVGLFRAEVKRLKIKTGPWKNHITSLSGGNQQKILIGRAFAISPKVILLDDPARGVDASTKRELYEELRSFARDGGSVIYLSSEIEEFFGLVDTVLVFRNGTLFDTVASDNMSEHSILTAMFGQTRGAGLNFDAGIPK
jgi:ABC-type sugar transport system ATPase subunit